MLIPQYHSYRRLAYVFLLIMSLALLGTISSSEKKVTSSSKAEFNSDVYEPIANQPLALARYRILMQIWRQTGEPPFPWNPFHMRDDVMFPKGQSDKVYILSMNTDPGVKGPHPVDLACYISTDKGVKLLYSVELKIVYKSAKDKIRVRNMLDVLSLLGGIKGNPKWSPESNPVPGNISLDAQRDLSLCQDLVDYSYVSDNDTDIYRLYVQCFNSKTIGTLDGNEPKLAFDIPKQPAHWYKAFGFPVADCELTAKGGKQKYQKKAASTTSPSSSEGDCGGDNSIQSSPIANQPLALARYRMLEKIERQTGQSPFPMSLTFWARDVFFTQGRSDKVYILTQEADVKLVCYKSVGKDLRLVYVVNLTKAYEPPKDKIRVTNMLDYLSMLGNGEGDPQWRPSSYALPENINSIAKSDLSLRQRLVKYSYVPYNGLLYVKCFNSKATESASKYEHSQFFDIPFDDSRTKVDEEYKWYKKYGLPVADCELTVLNKKEKGK